MNADKKLQELQTKTGSHIQTTEEAIGGIPETIEFADLCDQLHQAVYPLLVNESNGKIRAIIEDQVKSRFNLNQRKTDEIVSDAKRYKKAWLKQQELEKRKQEDEGLDDETLKKQAKLAEEKEKYQSMSFPEIPSEELLDILDITIKCDKTNKLITFLSMLTAYTEDSQLNISNNGPSSSGKSYTSTEIAKLFPKEDVIDVGYCSPTAFFHDIGTFDKEIKGYRVDLSRKILIFLDQPHNQLIAHLRPLLSHDQKTIAIKITDKAKKSGLKTKNIFLIGFPVVVFCTTNLGVDEQELTRFLFLSPETSQKKLELALEARVKREANKIAVKDALGKHQARNTLKERIKAIKYADVDQIIVPFGDEVLKRFKQKTKMLKPRHNRDMARLMSLIKGFALLNLWERERIDNNLIATQNDVNNAFDIWDEIAESQELNLPPFILRLFHEIIMPEYRDSGMEPISKEQVVRKHWDVYGRPLPEWQLRKQIIPMLASAALVEQVKGEEDKRQTLIQPIEPQPSIAEQYAEKMVE